jgi:hypothetical protein
MNTKSASLLLTGAMMIATVIPAFAADTTPAPAAQPAKTVSAPEKASKAPSLKKKSHVASKKQTDKTAIVKKTK